MTIRLPFTSRQFVSNPLTSFPVIPRYNGANPFSDSQARNFYDTFKTWSFTITLLGPLRFLMMVIILMFGTILSVVVTFNQPVDKPLNKTYLRQKGIDLLRFMIRMLLFVGGFFYIPINYDELSDLKNARCIVCNHFSAWDSIILLSIMECSPIVKAELLQTPLLGHVLRALQSVGVERVSDNGKHQALHNIEIRMKDTRYPPVLIFPQGTTCFHAFMTMWKTGAFTPGLPTQPIVIKYENEYSSLDLTHGNTSNSMYKACCQFINYSHVDVLPMYYPTQEEISNPTLYAKSLREIVADHLGILLTDHSYEDYLLHCAAKNTKINADHLITYKISEILGLHYTLVLKSFKIFCSYDKDKNGYYTCKNLYDFFCIEKTNDKRFKHMINVIFRFADTNQNGKLEVEEFMSLLACMMCSKNVEYMISLLFQCLDFDESGTINKNYLQQFINDYKFYDLVENEIQQMYDILFLFDQNETCIQFDYFCSKLYNHYQLLRAISSYIFKNIFETKDWYKFEFRFN